MERTNIITYIVASEKRKKIAKTLLDYPKRQWSCPILEDYTKLSHATVFRTITSLKSFGIIKSTRINRRDILYELVETNPLVEEVKRVIGMEMRIARNIAEEFAASINKDDIFSIILYGSSVKGNMAVESDIDLLIIVDKKSKKRVQELYDTAANLSSRINKTISITIIDTKEFKKEKETPFIKSIKEAREVIYGKEPF